MYKVVGSKTKLNHHHIRNYMKNPSKNTQFMNPNRILSHIKSA